MTEVTQAWEALKERILRESQEAHLETPLPEPFVLEVKRDGSGMTYAIKEDFRPIARALILKFREKELKLATGQADEIIFIVNASHKPKKNGRPKIVNIGKIPTKFAEILWQITGHYFNYVLTYYSAWLPAATPSQVTAILYHEIRHIDGLGGVKVHDIEDWDEMYRRLGANWEHLDLPDLLAEGVDWEHIVIPVLLPDPVDPEVEITDTKGGKARGSVRSLRRTLEKIEGRDA